MGAEPGTARHRRARAARVRDRPHRRGRADSVGRAARSFGGAGRPPGGGDPLPPRRALAQGARDPEGGGLLEGAEPAWRDRRVGGERGPVAAAVLAVGQADGRTVGLLAVGGSYRPTVRSSDCRMPKGGLEPPRACAHWLLKPARLPVPPLRLGGAGNGEYRPRYNLKSTLRLTALEPVSILPMPGGQARHRPESAGAS